MTTSDRARSLTDRIRLRAEAEGTDPQRLRRAVVFQRVLARLDGRTDWVLKGGFCLEARFGLDSRATKDLDLVSRARWGPDGTRDLQEDLVELLGAPLDDGFRFEIGRPRRRAIDDQETWQVALTALLERRVVAQIRLDIVPAFDEVVGGIEWLRVPAALAGPGLDDVVVSAVDVHQHAAEKIHAFARSYAHGRPSSRVKDLVDLVLLCEAGVLDPARLRDRLVVVYRERDGSAPPDVLPAPPTHWGEGYPALVREHGLSVAAADIDSAAASLTELYRRTAPRADAEGIET